MAADVALVIDLAPALASEDPARIDRFIGYAELSINVDKWGSLADMGTAYLAAHLLTVSSAAAAAIAGASGPVTNETVGAVARSYASPASGSAFANSEYGSTVYGRRYLELLRTLSLTPQVL